MFIYWAQNIIIGFFTVLSLLLDRNNPNYNPVDRVRFTLRIHGQSGAF